MEFLGVLVARHVPSELDLCSRVSALIIVRTSADYKTAVTRAAFHENLAEAEVNLPKRSILEYTEFKKHLTCR